MYLPSLLRLSALAVALIPHGALTAQTEGNTEVRTEGGEEAEAKAKRLEQMKAEKGAEDGADGQVHGDPVAINPAALASYAYAHVTTRPRRLAPGETGELVIVLALQAPVVVPGDASVTLTYDPQQAPLKLGTYRMLPPKPGTLETKFKGQLVHDNTLTVEVPVGIDPQAEFGEALVALTLKTTLSHGATGVAMGEMVMPINGRIKVGRSVPRPVARDNPAAVDDGVARSTPTPVAKVVPSAAPAALSADDESAETTRAAAPVRATNLDGVAMDVSFPAKAALPLGGDLTVQVDLHVPDGKWLVRADADALALAVSGADAGVTAELAAWPEPITKEIGAGEMRVSGGTLSMPVTFVAAVDAARGLRNLEFRLTYSTIGPEASPSATQVITLPAVLSVGSSPTVASAGLFYIAGLCLALLLAVVVIRALRR